MADTDFNPILEEIKLPRLGLFGKSPSPRPGVALVLFRPGQSLVTLWPGQKMTLGEMRFGGYTTAYEVDLSEKTFDLTCSLPSQNAAYEFQAAVRASYRVSDPAAVVQHQVTDPPETLRPLMIQTLRSKSREYQIEAVHEAEPGLTLSLKQADYGRGLKITEAVITLKLDASARDYVRKLDDMERQKVVKLTEIRHQEELQKAQAQLEKLTETQRQTLLQQRLQFYNPLVESGNWQMLSLLLANNPGDVKLVAQMVQDQRQKDFENFLNAIGHLVDKDMLESFDLGPFKKEVLKGFVESVRPQAAGLPGAEERPALGSGQDETGEGTAEGEPGDQTPEPSE